MKLKLTRNMKIILVIGLAIFLLYSSQKPASQSVTQLAPISISQVSIRVLNKVTSAPIVNAQIMLTCTDLTTNYGKQYTFITDSNGVGSNTIAPGNYAVSITKTGYDQFLTSISATLPTVSMVYQMTPNGGTTPPGSHDLTVFFVVNYNAFIEGAHITFNGVTYASDSNGKVLLFSVPEGSYSVHIWGPSVKNGLSTDYDFIASLVVGANQGAYVYTSYCNSNTLLNESPHLNGGGGNGDLWAWLLSSSLIGVVPNWVLIVAAILVLLLLRG
jgi:hypothetical protein